MTSAPRTYKRTLLRDAAEFAVLALVEWVLCCVGPRASLAFGRHLGRLGHRLIRRYPKVARENLRHAYPGLGERDLERLSVRAAEHLGQGVAEGIVMPRLLRTREQIDARVEQHVHAGSLEAMRSGRPVIFATGHFGNWELGSLMAWYHGVRIASVMRPLDNRFLNRRVVAFRKRLMQRLIDKHGAMRGMARSLREGVSVATLIDQDARREGIFVDFFGRPASTVDGVAALALRFDVPVIVGYMLRTKEPGRFAFHLEEPLPFERTGDEREDRRRLTQRMTLLLEQAIRRHPEQWVWFHQRWKTRPPSGRPAVASP